MQQWAAPFAGHHRGTNKTTLAAATFVNTGKCTCPIDLPSKQVHPNPGQHTPHHAHQAGLNKNYTKGATKSCQVLWSAGGFHYNYLYCYISFLPRGCICRHAAIKGCLLLVGLAGSKEEILNYGRSHTSNYDATYQLGSLCSIKSQCSAAQAWPVPAAAHLLACSSSAEQPPADHSFPASPVPSQDCLTC